MPYTDGETDKSNLEKENALFYDRIQELVKAKDQAYWERNQLVVLLSKIFPAHLAKHPESDTNWENDWRTIVCIHFPSGQGSWHIHDSEVGFFSHLELKSNDWDGHTTEEKYKRILSYGNTTQKNKIIYSQGEIRVRNLDEMPFCFDCKRKLIIPHLDVNDPIAHCYYWEDREKSLVYFFHKKCKKRWMNAKKTTPVEKDE